MQQEGQEEQSFPLLKKDFSVLLVEHNGGACLEEMTCINVISNVMK